MLVQSYLFFDGRCEEAIEFYQKALGAKVDMIMRNKESPEPPPPGMTPAPEKIMHASFRIGDTQVMASDGHATGKPNVIVVQGGFHDYVVNKLRGGARSDKPARPRMPIRAWT